MNDRLDSLERADAERVETAKLEGYEESFDRADALQQSQIGNESRRSTMNGKSHAQALHDEMEKLRANMPTKATRETMKTFQEAFKAVKLTATAHTGEEENHASWIKDITVAFELNEMTVIVDDNEQAWYDFCTKEENEQDVIVMEKTMKATLHLTLKKGSAFTEYEDFEKGNKRDARGMFLAARDAYDKSNSTLTRKVLKKKLEDMKWTAETKLDEFYHKFTVVVDLIGKVKGTDGKTKPMEPEDQTEAFKKKFTDGQRELSSEMQTWHAVFANADLIGAQTDTELTLKQLKSLISLRLDDGMEVQTGAVMQHSGHLTNNGGSRYSGECWNKGCKELHPFELCTKPLVCDRCGKDGHVGRKCPERTKETLSRFNTARDAQYKMFEQWSKQQETQQGKNNAQQSTSYDSDDDVPWHIGIPDTDGVMQGVEIKEQRAAAEAAKLKGKGKKKGNCKAQRRAAEENREAERSKAAEAKGPPKEWDGNMQERIALAQFDLNNMKLKDPDGEYELIDFLE